MSVDSLGSYQRIIRLKDERIKESDREIRELRAALAGITAYARTHQLPSVARLAQFALERERS